MDTVTTKDNEENQVSHTRFLLSEPMKNKPQKTLDSERKSRCFLLIALSSFLLVFDFHHLFKSS